MEPLLGSVGLVGDNSTFNSKFVDSNPDASCTPLNFSKQKVYTHAFTVKENILRKLKCPRTHHRKKVWDIHQ